jgi:hypothetical protein
MCCCSNLPIYNFSTKNLHTTACYITTYKGHQDTSQSTDVHRWGEKSDWGTHWHSSTSQTNTTQREVVWPLCEWRKHWGIWTNTILNLYWVLPRCMLLKSPLNYIFIHTALPSTMNKTFWTWNWQVHLNHCCSLFL